MEGFAGDWIDKCHTAIANHMGEAGGFPAAQDLAETVDHIGAAVGIAEALPLLDGQFGDQGADVRLTVAVSQPGQIGQSTQADGQDTGISLIGLPCPIHGVVNGLLRQRVGILDGGGFADTNASLVD